MKKKISIVEIRGMVSTAMQKRKDLISKLEGSTTPASCAAKEYYQATYQALLAVHDALKGNNVLLLMMGE